MQSSFILGFGQEVDNPALRGVECFKIIIRAHQCKLASTLELRAIILQYTYYIIVIVHVLVVHIHTA